MSKYELAAIALGATLQEGINWTWANHFPTREKAQEFLDMFPDMEARGIYNDSPRYSVRFR